MRQGFSWLMAGVVAGAMVAGLAGCKANTLQRVKRP